MVMKTFGNAFLLWFLFWIVPALSVAQSCSCAGAPLLSSQSISSTSAGNLLLGLTYEFNNISDMYEGTRQVKNPPVKRNTQTMLLEANYGLSNRLTVSGTFTIIRKRREAGLQNPGANDVFKSDGIGDGLFMLKYVLHKNTIRSQYQLAVGAGTKVPFGEISERRNGLQLNMDMQPGTGAWDGILWSYFSKTFAPATTINLFAINTYRFTGRNERFRNSTEGYKFGNEFVSTLGAKDKFFSGFSYVVMFRYRSAGSDQLGDDLQPNTGGKWFSIIPGLNYSVNNNISLRLSSQLPLFQDLNGIQPTTEYTLSASVFYNFKKKTIF